MKSGNNKLALYRLILAAMPLCSHDAFAQAPARRGPAAPGLPQAPGSPQPVRPVPAVSGLPQARIGFQQVIAQYDRNKDGFLTQADFPPDTWARLKHLDRDPPDGNITEAEVTSMGGGLKPTASGERSPDAAAKVVNQIFPKMDINKNGFIDGAELPAESIILRRADADRDGRVAQSELEQLLQSQTAISP